MRENGGEVMLAYGMNKNLKKLRDRPKSAKPMRKKTKKQDQLVVAATACLFSASLTFRSISTIAYLSTSTSASRSLYFSLSCSTMRW